MSNEKRCVVLLADERSFMERLAEKLCARHDWEVIVTNFLNEAADRADLIIAEEKWLPNLEHCDELLNKTIFLFEDDVGEASECVKGFPRMFCKYDGFQKIEMAACEALEELLRRNAGEKGTAKVTEKDLPKVVIVGAWNGERAKVTEMARDLAHTIDGTVLFMEMERFPRDSEENDQEERRGNGPGRTLEDLLYYALERIGILGCDAEDSFRAAMSFCCGVSALPGFLGMNPLHRLSRKEWEHFLPFACAAARAKAVFLWVGREELTQCGGFAGLVRQCVYLKPEQEDGGWERFQRWLKDEGTMLIEKEVVMADSWTEMYRTVMEFGSNLE